MASNSPHDHSGRDNNGPAAVGGTPAASARAIVALLAGMAAAWIAAGSTGLLAHPLRHALTLAALVVATAAAWPRRGLPMSQWLALGAAAIACAIMTASTLPAVNVLAVALLLAVLSRSHGDVTGRTVLLSATAAAVLGIFRMACTSIPVVWKAADAVGGALGGLAGALAGEPLWVGATFGGVDFLVLMAALYAGWLVNTAPPRHRRALYAAAAIVGGHLLFLMVLSLTNRLLDALPEVVLAERTDINYVGAWAWGNAARTLLPWNLPVLALVIHATIAAAMFRWSAWLPVADAGVDDGDEDRRMAPAIEAAARFGPAVLAVTVPLLIAWSIASSDLAGKTVVAYQRGYLNWLKPEHDSPITGTYGTLPLLIESLGGRFLRSDDLSQQDLAKADLLLLLHPDQPWDQSRLDRVWQYVRDGGALLLVAEPSVLDGNSKSSFNDVLQPTAMAVRYDTAVSETNHWEQTCEPLAHPVTAGIDDRRNRFGLGVGSSIQTRWPARPILAGRFGWSDPGSDAALTGAPGYDAGEKLGDLVLAAEQRLGRGTVMVLGDASCLHNETTVNSYPFVGRVLGYLAGQSGSPQSWWRQSLGLLGSVALLGLLVWRPTALRVAVTSLLLAVSLQCCAAASRQTTRVLPQGGHLACIDASHMEAYSSDAWDDFGIGGLSRALMRDGYLPLLLPELTPERLGGAALLISIGPARSFSAAERETVDDFVRKGGTFICMVGAERAAASRELLADFDFRVPPSPVRPEDTDTREPEPVGALYSRYLQLDGYETDMRLYAGWPVQCTGQGAEVLKRSSEDWPVIIRRPVGRGVVVLIGDTFLATNQNLESLDGEIRDNMQFWRWLLPRVTKREAWIPPKPEPESEPDDAAPVRGGVDNESAGSEETP